MRNSLQNGELNPMETSDEALMNAYQQGDQTALAGLVRRHADSLLGYLVRLCMQRQQAEDVFQETFLRVHRKAGSFRAGNRFKPWLYAIATHLAIDSLRRRSRWFVSLEEDEKPIIDPGPTPSESAAQSDRQTQVRKALEALPPRQRATVVLTYFEGLSYPEAAQSLGCSVGTVKKQMSRALETLARLLPDAAKEGAA